jgi:hypothetical protein
MPCPLDQSALSLDHVIPTEEHSERSRAPFLHHRKAVVARRREEAAFSQLPILEITSTTCVRGFVLAFG